MTHVLIRIPTRDYDAWRPVFDDYANVRRDSGSLGGVLYCGAESPNEVYIIWQWATADRARQFFQSDGLREAMQKAGVTGRPAVFYLDEVENLAA